MSLADNRKLVLRAVCDTNLVQADKVTKEYRQRTEATEEIGIFESYQDLLRDEALDIVAITVPSGLHFRIAREALDSGKHVVLEKPMTLSLEEAHALRQLSLLTGRKIFVCHQKRLYPHLQSIRNTVANGMLGDIVGGSLAVFYNRDDAYYAASSWRGTWGMDGGVLLNQAIHDIDILLWFVGAPAVVQGQVSRQKRKIEAEDTAAGTLLFESGALFSLLATVCAPRGHSHESLSIIGTNGAFTLSGKTLEPSYWNVPGVAEPTVVTGNPHGWLYEDVYSSILKGDLPQVGATDVLTSLETIFAIYQSFLTDGSVRLPLNEMSTKKMQGTFQ